MSNSVARPSTTQRLIHMVSHLSDPRRTWESVALPGPVYTPRHSRRRTMQYSGSTATHCRRISLRQRTLAPHTSRHYSYEDSARSAAGEMHLVCQMSALTSHRCCGSRSRRHTVHRTIKRPMRKHTKLLLGPSSIGQALEQRPEQDAHNKEGRECPNIERRKARRRWLAVENERGGPSGG